MNLTLATLLKNALELKSSDIEVHPDYSGRFMHGKKTTAISGKFTANCIWKIIIKHRDEIEEKTPLETIDIRSDSFGLDTIVY